MEAVAAVGTLGGLRVKCMLAEPKAGLHANQANQGWEAGSGRGLHSFRFQLNLSSSVHRVTQLKL